MKVVNQPIMKKDAMALVTGKPVFTNDKAPKECLIVKLLRSPYANAMIKSINTQFAMKVPGIEAIYTWEDVPQERFTMAGQTFPESVQIEVRGKKMKYVSRGGYKLEQAMNVFPISLTDTVCMDVGSSTGGFTDCMLQNGAVKVYSVDVGHGQLAWKLRNDERVVCMEKTNIRYVTPDDIEDRIAFASIDVSFISLTKVLPPVKELLTDDGEIVCLIKPQFEAGREKVGKKGVVRDQKVHVEVVEMIVDFARQIGFKTLDLSYSPIKGPEGNIEYLVYIKKAETGSASEIDVKAVVEAAHGELDK